MVALAAVVSLIVGWLQSDEEYLTPKSGLGYWLGIVGGSMMLLLLVYSYRKRHPMSRLPGSTPIWFRVHMFLGIFGPVLVIYHANFRLGALNSNVAFFAMLIVALSGVIGRYIYGKIHMGVHGRKAEAREIREDLEEMRKAFDVDLVELGSSDRFFQRLDAFNDETLAARPSGAHDGLLCAMRATARSLALKNEMRSSVRDLVRITAEKEHWSLHEQQQRAAILERRLSTYITATLKALELSFYERLFAAWHVLHLPLFFVLVVTALLHVWAVHRY
ncbi:hypothetical protein B1812_20800 [Methylocystis bryophila]|uniref:Pyridine nucleotide-disulfide oxidoreductase n=1 Tax=Methylocystis bryophila TaxID=655015 RepID=A0A1W6N264_9HYPH|nr:hypothetical protein B1812_20800 [Methylocystis bryophila]